MNSYLRIRIFFLSFTCLVFTRMSNGQTKIPLEILPSGHLIVKAEVNGVVGRFIFDTGAGITLLTKPFADQLSDVHKQDGMFTGFRATGERLDLQLFQINKIRIGQLSVESPVVAILDVNIADCDGILSLMPFRKQPFTIDLKDSCLILESPASLAKRKRKGESVALQLHADRGLSLDIFAYFRLNETQKLLFLLDSGAGHNTFWINSRYLKACGINVADTARVKKIVTKSEFDTSSGTVFYKTHAPALAL